MSTEIQNVNTAQTVAPSQTPASPAPAVSTSNTTVIDTELQKMLQKLGITIEQWNAMSPQDQANIKAQYAQIQQEAAAEQTGMGITGLHVEHTGTTLQAEQVAAQVAQAEVKTPEAKEETSEVVTPETEEVETENTDNEEDEGVEIPSKFAWSLKSKAKKKEIFEQKLAESIDMNKVTISSSALMAIYADRRAMEKSGYTQEQWDNLSFEKKSKLINDIITDYDELQNINISQEEIEEKYSKAKIMQSIDKIATAGTAKEHFLKLEKLHMEELREYSQKDFQEQFQQIQKNSPITKSNIVGEFLEIHKEVDGKYENILADAGIDLSKQDTIKAIAEGLSEYTLKQLDGLSEEEQLQELQKIIIAIGNNEKLKGKDHIELDVILNTLENVSEHNDIVKKYLETPDAFKQIFGSTIEEAKTAKNAGEVTLILDRLEGAVTQIELIYSTSTEEISQKQNNGINVDGAQVANIAKATSMVACGVFRRLSMCSESAPKMLSIFKKNVSENDNLTAEDKDEVAREMASTGNRILAQAYVDSNNEIENEDDRMIFKGNIVAVQFDDIREVGVTQSYKGESAKFQEALQKMQLGIKPNDVSVQRGMNTALANSAIELGIQSGFAKMIMEASKSLKGEEAEEIQKGLIDANAKGCAPENQQEIFENIMTETEFISVKEYGAANIWQLDESIRDEVENFVKSLDIESVIEAIQTEPPVEVANNNSEKAVQEVKTSSVEEFVSSEVITPQAIISHAEREQAIIREFKTALEVDEQGFINLDLTKQDNCDKLVELYSENPDEITKYLKTTSAKNRTEIIVALCNTSKTTAISLACENPGLGVLILSTSQIRSGIQQAVADKMLKEYQPGSEAHTAALKYNNKYGMFVSQNQNNGMQKPFSLRA